MALDIERLTGKIRAILDRESTEEENPEESRDRFSRELATVIVAEIKEAKIIYTNGLVTPAGGGAVTGTFNGSLQ